MEREEYIAYGIPFIILSITASGLGLYLSQVYGREMFGNGVFVVGAVLTVLFIGIFIVPALKSLFEEYYVQG